MDIEAANALLKDIDAVNHERMLMEAYSEEWDRNTPKYDGDDRTAIEVYDAGFLTKQEFWYMHDKVGITHKYNDDGTDPGNCSVCHFYHR